MARNKEACCPKPRKRNPCGKSKKKCTKPGPVTNNGFLNFLRAFRKKNCGLKPREVFKAAARAWRRLPDKDKNRYRRMACKVTTSPRHLRRRICQTCKETYQAP